MLYKEPLAVLLDWNRASEIKKWHPLLVPNPSSPLPSPSLSQSSLVMFMSPSPPPNPSTTTTESSLMPLNVPWWSTAFWKQLTRHKPLCGDPTPRMLGLWEKSPPSWSPRNLERQGCRCYVALGTWNARMSSHRRSYARRSRAVTLW